MCEYTVEKKKAVHNTILRSLFFLHNISGHGYVSKTPT